MPAPARVVIAFARTDADPSAAGSLAVGFQREGLPVEQIDEAEKVVATLRGEDVLVASVGGTAGDGVALARAVRARLPKVPIILVGDADRRDAAADAGATAFIAKPAFVKDVVTLGRVVAMPREGLAPGWGGELDGLHLYYMVRALAATKKSGVMTLRRASRHGELRFFEGEVTSAAVGSLHGQAAFHQLLLWPEATFDLRLESVVRRQQIPLTPGELLQDAEKFLKDFSELAGGISPASLFEHDLVKAAENVDKIPKEVAPVMRLFDGARTVADVIEDSPLGLNDTMKVVARLVALGVIKNIAAPLPRRDAGAALLIEDWLVGQPEPGDGNGKPRRITVPVPAAVDWGSLGAAPGPAAPSYAPVVPAQTATGEILAVGPTPAPPVAAPSPKEGVETKIVGTNGKSTAKLQAIPVAPSETTKRDDGTRKSGSHAAVKGTGRSTGRQRAEKHFEDHEQAFFDQEHHFAAAHHEGPRAESFADLDEGRPRPSFWQRIFGKTPARRKKARKPGMRTAAGKAGVKSPTKKP